MQYSSESGNRKRFWIGLPLVGVLGFFTWGTPGGGCGGKSLELPTPEELAPDSPTSASGGSDETADAPQDEPDSEPGNSPADPTLDDSDVGSTEPFMEYTLIVGGEVLLDDGYRFYTTENQDGGPQIGLRQNLVYWSGDDVALAQYSEVFSQNSSYGSNLDKIIGIRAFGLMTDRFLEYEDLEGEWNSNLNEINKGEYYWFIIDPDFEGLVTLELPYLQVESVRELFTTDLVASHYTVSRCSGGSLTEAPPVCHHCENLPDVLPCGCGPVPSTESPYLDSETIYGGTC